MTIQYFRNDGVLVSPPWIYFIQCQRFVKIGTTAGSPLIRLMHVRTHCPLPAFLLAVIPGSASDERAWHVRFEDEHERGEWFRLTPRLSDAIAKLRPQMVPFQDRAITAQAKAKVRAKRRILAEMPARDVESHADSHGDGTSGVLCENFAAI